MIEYRCKKCKNGNLYFKDKKYICSSCFAYWENEDKKWKFKGYLDTTQHTTQEVWHGPRRIQKTTQQMNERTDLKCPKCSYEWKSKSKMIWITCPSCQYKSKQ